MTTSSVSAGSSRIDGLVSGLDTTSIINAIMAQAALPQTHLKSQLAQEQLKLAAYQSINTKMASLQNAAAALTSASSWQAMTVSSSSPTVSATAASGAQAGNFIFDVTQLATYQSSVFSGSVASTSASVVTGGVPVTITSGAGDPVAIDTGDGSLAAVVSGINKSDSGVRATAVQVSPGQYRLQLTSSTTGAGASFSVSGLDALGALQNTSTAQDAQITVGAGTAGAYTISSSTNTFSDAIPNMTFTVSQLAAGVTLATRTDADGISDKVQAMVDAANAVLDEITSDTKFDTSTNTASTLTGDSTVARLRNSILGSIGTMFGTGQSAANVGLSLTKDGNVTFDSTAFQAALTANPQDVQASFMPGGSFAAAQSLAGSVSLVNSTDATAAGSYDVAVTQAATKASATLDVSGGLVAGQTVTLGSGANSATYTVQAGETSQSLVDALNALAASNGLTVNATVGSGGLLDLTSTAFGSQWTFNVSATGGLAASGVTAGLDVAGTINGQPAKGIGQLLYTDSGTPGVDALTLKVTLTPDDVAALGGASAGSFTYTAGAAQQLASIANNAIAARTGFLANQIDGVNTTIANLNDQISNWQVVLDTKQAALQRQWANLESQLSNLKAQGDQLASAIKGLPSNSNSSS